MRRVAVYCGSRFGRDPRYRDAAEALGAELARRGLGLVYGGASVGLMGAVAQGALDAGGEVIGVIPGALAARELQHPGLTAMHTVDSMHERKARMSELADAFVALPGGLGTLDELAEAMTWTQLGIHRKPCGLLDVAGFWAPFVAMMDGFVATGFVDPSQRALLVVEDTPAALLDALAATSVPEGIWGSAGPVPEP
ncbi:MAG: TIGR00730 family Rossman fold protein [Thermoleophilia bacterium]